MFHIVKVRPLQNYRLALKFADGTEGEIDVSYLVGEGVFAKWQNVDYFNDVKIGSSGELIWGDDIDLCPDTLYMKITGKKAEDLFPMLRLEPVDA